jgi:hypothetical protein
LPEGKFEILDHRKLVFVEMQLAGDLDSTIVKLLKLLHCQMLVGRDAAMGNTDM